MKKKNKFLGNCAVKFKMSITSKVSGDAAEDNAAKCQPSGKWRPKINRSHLKDSPYMSLFSDKSDQKKPDVNGQTDSTENKVDSPKKTIISLKSVKNIQYNKDSTAKGKQSSTIIKLKRSSVNPNSNNSGNSGATGTAISSDPPKKNYTPIIWQQSVQSATNVAPKISSTGESPKKKYKTISWP